MSGRIKPTTAFRILNAGWQAEKRFAVVALTKAGKPSKAPINDICKAATQDEALRIKARLEELKPGRQFVVIDLKDDTNEASRNA